MSCLSKWELVVNNAERDWLLGDHFVFSLVYGCLDHFHAAEEAIGVIRDAITAREKVLPTGVCSLNDALTAAVETLLQPESSVALTLSRRSLVVLGHMLAEQAAGVLLIQQRFQALFQQLSPEQRLLLRLRYANGVSIAEIAATLSDNISSVASQLAVLRQHLLANLIPQDRHAAHGDSQKRDPVAFRGTANDCFLCSRFLDGQLSMPELERFDQQIQGDLPIARELAYCIRLHCLLRLSLRTKTAMADSPPAAGGGEIPDDLTRKRRSPGVRRALAVVAVVMFFFSLWWHFFS